ncbi:(deoxy)nucleoside triphosphate pyrophosphohydrolase [Rothia sp. P7181]|uniref:(deoxy)nucleoside triphosphate pyrophosphohydrolase n=1 Tax=unclassified Rothia (in: high G+C Gram-positive bacteria) TaxID=2689056 RepID=UPI003AE65034
MTQIFPLQVVGGAIVDSLEKPTRLLIGQRHAPKELAGLWEFPGGKVEADESCEQALARELDEELSIHVTLGQEITGPHRQGWALSEHAAMRVWFCTISSGEVHMIEGHQQIQWVDINHDLLSIDWIPADYPIVQQLIKMTTSSYLSEPCTENAEGTLN